LGQDDPEEKALPIGMEDDRRIGGVPLRKDHSPARRPVRDPRHLERRRWHPGRARSSRAAGIDREDHTTAGHPRPNLVGPCPHRARPIRRWIDGWIADDSVAVSILRLPQSCLPGEPRETTGRKSPRAWGPEGSVRIRPGIWRTDSRRVGWQAYSSPPPRQRSSRPERTPAPPHLPQDTGTVCGSGQVWRAVPGDRPSPPAARRVPAGAVEGRGSSGSALASTPFNSASLRSGG
jgi:hypothetical protein